MQHEQVLFSLPLKRMEPIIKNWLREVLNETPNTNEVTDNSNEPELISRDELKKLTGISSDATIIKHERSGLFLPHRLGRKVFYKRSEVIEAFRKFNRI